MIHGIAIEDAGMSKSFLNRKPAKLLIILALVLFVSLPIIRPFEVAISSNHLIKLKITQESSHGIMAETTGSWNLSIPVALYDAYKAVPDSTEHEMDLQAMT